MSEWRRSTNPRKILKGEAETLSPLNSLWRIGFPCNSIYINYLERIFEKHLPICHQYIRRSPFVSQHFPIFLLSLLEHRGSATLCLYCPDYPIMSRSMGVRPTGQSRLLWPTREHWQNNTRWESQRRRQASLSNYQLCRSSSPYYKQIVCQQIASLLFAIRKQSAGSQ